MSTFIQWLGSLDKNPDPKQFTWVCGSEHVLQNEVVSYILQRLDVPALNHHVYDAETDAPNKILEGLSQYPMGLTASVHVVKNAQALTDFSMIPLLIKNRSKNPKRYVIFQSTEEKVPTVYNKDTRKNVRLPHIAAFSGKGTIVECKPFANTAADNAIRWVQYKSPVSPHIATLILNNAGGNLRLVRDTCVKINALGTPNHIPTINKIMEHEPQETFVNALLTLNYKDAHRSVPNIPVSDYSTIIGQLDSVLELVALLRHLRIEGRPTSDLMQAAGTRSFLVFRILDHLAHYNPVKVQEIRAVLLACDQHLADGATEAMLETIIAVW